MIFWLVGEDRGGIPLAYLDVGLSCAMAALVARSVNASRQSSGVVFVFKGEKVTVG